LKTEINFDDLNIYVRSKIPTHHFLKIFLFIFNLSAITGLFWFVYALQDDKPNILPLLLPIIYSVTMGKYLLWNTFGEEYYIVSTTHISYQHYYGFWQTKLRTSKYDFISTKNIKSKSDEKVTLVFVQYSPEKLQEVIFSSALSISLSDSNRIFNTLNEIKIDEFGQDVSFPKIFSN
jgi:hypothetical protein